MASIKDLIQKSNDTLKKEGIQGFSKHVQHYIKSHMQNQPKGTMKDVLFINGCSPDLLPHPWRYRVKYQREQLSMFGMTSDEIYYTNITLDLVRNYHTFVIFRAPYTKQLAQFVKLAKRLHKTVFYDVDDLVISTEYTDSIPYIHTMANKERYDQDVTNNGKLLSMCDHAITTTEALAGELSGFVKDVTVHRNCAGIDLVQLSQAVKKSEHETIRIGYFSGSITHNDDFRSIVGVLCKLFDKYPQLELWCIGQLDLPDELVNYTDRIHAHPFMDYTELPSYIAQVDINLAPLKETLFNAAKSEIKWIEAALVKVPTVASDWGAFEKMIDHGQTGLLCKTEQDWEKALVSLIESRTLREKLANHAYTYVLEHCISETCGYNLVQTIQKHRAPNIAFAVSKLDISGGIRVMYQHACILQDQGWDVSILSYYDKEHWARFEDHALPILPLDAKKMDIRMERVVATMWPTVSMIEKLPNIDWKMYLVQNYEPGFYPQGDPHRMQAVQSYCPRFDVRFITISKWCQKWLKKKYGKKAAYIPNGLDLQAFTPVQRDWSGKIRILIEGDSYASHKNVDESFRITNRLDPGLYEIWYVSYNGKPKEWYRVDRFFHQVEYQDIPSIYQSCHILLKSSLLESFSYPPLEMMSTGGLVIALPNEGNQEYLIDQVNCLFYEKGNIEQALMLIDTLCHDPKLREKLSENGRQTALSRNWEDLTAIIQEAYK